MTVDTVDDGGGGNSDFAIEDTGSSDAGGSDSSTRDTSGSDDASGSDSSDGSDSDSETGSEETEAGEESDSEESEAEETEEAEEEETSEEEEDSEGPASGPIAPPVSIINTSTLEQRGAINDPISGSGNPALLDPNVNVGVSGAGGE